MVVSSLKSHVTQVTFLFIFICFKLLSNSSTNLERDGGSHLTSLALGVTPQYVTHQKPAHLLANVKHKSQ